MRLQKVEKEYLTLDELEIIMSKKIEFPRLEKVRDIYVICCFTGLAYSDVKSLTKDLINIINDRMWIKKKMNKTKIMSLIPLLKDASNILNKFEQLNIYFNILFNTK